MPMHQSSYTFLTVAIGELTFYLFQRILCGVDGGGDSAGLRDLIQLRHPRVHHPLPGIARRGHWIHTVQLGWWQCWSAGSQTTSPSPAPCPPPTTRYRDKRTSCDDVLFYPRLVLWWGQGWLGASWRRDSAEKHSHSSTSGCWQA